jgi:hypothetical protein
MGGYLGQLYRMMNHAFPKKGRQSNLPLAAKMTAANLGDLSGFRHCHCARPGHSGGIELCRLTQRIPRHRYKRLAEFAGRPARLIGVLLIEQQLSRSGGRVGHGIASVAARLGFTEAQLNADKSQEYIY